MNTIEELTTKYGLDIHTAQRMIDGYKKRIGSMNGIHRVEDIEYVGDGTKRVSLKCSLCGREYVRDMRSGRNKWSELMRTCECEVERERQERKERAEIQKSEKEKARCFVLQKEIGNKYGDYRVINYEMGNPDVLIGECIECGHIRRIGYKTKDTSDCHCPKHYVQTTKFDESYIGKKNNMLTVIGITAGKDGHKRFICKCDCGKKTTVKPTFWENGSVVSCGCYQTYRSVYSDEIDRLNRIYRGMKKRCYNENDKSYRYYGKRGITICQEWLNDVNEFIRWSYQNGYENTRTIDRIDPDGNYEPSNCRWATWDIQNSNHRPRKKQSEYEQVV